MLVYQRVSPPNLHTSLIWIGIPAISGPMDQGEDSVACSQLSEHWPQGDRVTGQPLAERLSSGSNGFCIFLTMDDDDDDQLKSLALGLFWLLAKPLCKLLVTDTLV